MSTIFLPRRRFVRKVRTYSRRRFIQTSGIAMMAGALTSVDELFVAAANDQVAPEQKKKNLVGSNIYGWGQYYQRMKKNVNDNLDEVFSALRNSGYDYLEGFLDVSHPENNLKFADRMRSQGLSPVSIYTGARLHEAGNTGEVVQRLLGAAKLCRQAGFSIIDCNLDPIGREKTEDELKTQAGALNELGAGLKQLGLRLAIHNHMPEMANHAREFHYDLRQTKAAVVGLCYDVHWVFRGGIAPAEVLKEYGNRVASWHLRQSRNNTWWEDLDQGDIDYDAMAQYAKAHGLTAPYTVELALETGTNITRSVIENHQRSREFVRKVFGI